MDFDIGFIDRQDMIDAAVEEPAIVRDEDKTFFAVKITGDDLP